MADEEAPYKFMFMVAVMGADGKTTMEAKTSNAPCTYTEDKAIIPYTGEAVVSYKNKDSYTGRYSGGKKCGRGVYCYFASGDKYDGHWKDDRKHGMGTMQYYCKGKEVEGDEDKPKKEKEYQTYQGYWENDKRHGEGVFTYLNGDTYSGWWRFGQKEGKGTFISKATGMKMVGDWEKGEMKRGRWVYPNGFYYEGEFVNNKPNGQGAWYCKDGNVVRGCFE